MTLLEMPACPLCGRVGLRCHCEGRLKFELRKSRWHDTWLLTTPGTYLTSYVHEVGSFRQAIELMDLLLASHKGIDTGTQR